MNHFCLYASGDYNLLINNVYNCGNPIMHAFNSSTTLSTTVDIAQYNSDETKKRLIQRKSDST